MSIHILPPYRGWEDFRPRIHAALEAYQDIVKPGGIKRIGVRYINRIVIPYDHVNLGRFFATPPQMPDELDVNISNFFLRLETTYVDLPIQLIQTHASAPSEPGTAAFILDLDVIGEWKDDSLPIEDGLSQVDILRDRERDAFEALITDQAREIFDADR